MNKSSPTNIALLMVALICVLGWIWNREHPKVDESRKKQLSTLKVEPPPPLEVPKDPFSDAEMAIYHKILVSYSTGAFQLSVTQVEEALAKPSVTDAFKDWLTRQLPVLMTSQAWLLIKTQDCDDAVKIFYRVLGLAQIPEAQKGLGYCLRVIKSWPEAAGYLAAYVLTRPADTEGRLIYADTLESLGRFDEAVTILEGAAHQEGLDPQLQGLVNEKLAGMRAKAKGGQGQKTERSDHFYVRYREEEHEGILRPVLDLLEAAIDEYAEVLAIVPPITPVEVVLYRKEEFHDVIPGGPGWAEGVFDGRIRVPVSANMVRDVNGDLATVLRHELSHAMLSIRSNGRGWPTWFDEGLAQYLSCRKRSCDNFRFPATPGTFSAIETLTQPFVTLNAIAAGDAYLHSLYLTRFLISSKREDALALISSATAPGGPISSDFIAETSGWKSFAEFWGLAMAQWSGRKPF